MLSGNCTEALSIQANVTISCSSARLIKNGIAPLPFPLPALLKQYWYIQCGERVRVRGHAQSCAKLSVTTMCRKQPDHRPDRYDKQPVSSDLAKPRARIFKFRLGGVINERLRVRYNL